MCHYENNKQRGENLEKLLLVLKNIAPTSVYAEQAFSVASSFVPNRRSRLTDLSIALMTSFVSKKLILIIMVSELINISMF